MSALGRGGIVVVATKNAGKAREFAEMLGKLGLVAKSLADYPEVPDIAETGTTFAENALIKAKAAAVQLGVPALADDSGLCVDALGGEPGVYSARYSGEHAADTANCAKLLAELRARAGEPDPAGTAGAPAPLYGAARFICALALYDPAAGRAVAEVEGACPGRILAEPRGEHGFGYDPLFYLPEFGRTMAELAPQEKNRISHRAQALQKLLERLASEV